MRAPSMGRPGGAVLRESGCGLHRLDNCFGGTLQFLISFLSHAQVHEAIMRAPSEEHPDGTVLQEFRRGFTIGGHLLRPAMVQVGGTRPRRCDTSEQRGHSVAP